MTADIEPSHAPGRWWPAAPLSALLCAAFLIYLQALPNNDVAWFLAGTEKWLDGARLYDGVIEVNPPLVFYLNLVPVLIARWTGLAATDTFVLCLFALIVLSLVLVARLLADGPGGLTPPGWILLFASFAALAIFPTRDFGQREHLTLILGLPYLFLVAGRVRCCRTSFRFALLVGLLAGLGFALKPQFLVLPTLLELYLILRFHKLKTVFRPEALTLAATVAVYSLSIPLLALDYLTRVVPMALLVYNQGYQVPPLFVFLSWHLVVVPAVFLFHLSRRRQQCHPEIADVLLIGCAVFYAIYLSEMKGWSYQVMPVSALAFLASAAVLASEPRRVLAGLLAGSMLLVPALKGTYHNEVASALAGPVRENAAGRALFVFSSYVWVGFPLTNMAQARWSSRFPCLWLLPGAERGLHSPTIWANPALAAEYSKIERYTINAVVEDLTRDPPAVIVIDERPDSRFGGRNFNYIAFFLSDQRFAAIWSRYERVQRVVVPGFGPYEIYRRTGSKP